MNHQAMVNNRFQCHPSWRIWTPATESSGWSHRNKPATVCTCSTLTLCKHLVRNRLYNISLPLISFVFQGKTPLNYSLVWTPFFSNLGAANDLLIFSSFLFIQKTAANLLRATRWWDPSAGICKTSWLVSSANRTIIPTFDIVHHIRDIYVHTTPVPTLIVRTAKTKRPIG